MNLPELIENLHLDLNQYDRSVINETIVANYSDQDLVRLIDIFLRGIGSRHQVNGNIVWRLADMASQYRTAHALTPKQRIYIIQNILENWQELNLDMRVALGL